MNSFESAAGVSPEHLSHFIRVILCTTFFLWAAWNVYGLIQLGNDHHSGVFELPMGILRILFLCAFMVILVFVS